MNFHIIPQDKFFCSYIEDVYRINCENDNLFFVKGFPGDNIAFQTSRKVEYLGNDPEQYFELLSKLKKDDRLFISWYDSFVGNIVVASGIECKVFVYLMGGEFYSEPFWKHAGWLLDARTLSLAKELYLPAFSLCASPKDNYLALKHRLQIKKSQEKQYEAKLASISRVDYLIVPPCDEVELEFMRELYPTLKAEPVFGLFNQNYEVARMLDIPDEERTDGGVNILVGNSADICNNHVDAFHLIHERFKGDGYTVFCPLSYGDGACRRRVIEYGREMFGDSFVAVTEFMPADEYVAFVNKMDLVLMNHNRQQALGNIIIALTLGKAVVLKENNPVYAMMRGLGVPVTSLEDLHPNDIPRIIEFAKTERRRTVSLIEKHFSDNTRLSLLRNTLYL